MSNETEIVTKNNYGIQTASQSYDPVLKEHLGIAKTAHELSRKIVDSDTAQDAVGHLLWIKEKRRIWEAMVRPVIQSAHEAHKKAMALFKEIDQPLKRAETEILKPALDKYDLEQERKRVAEENRLNKIIRDEAEAKRKADDKKRAEEAEKTKIVDTQGKIIPPSEPPPPPPPPAIIPTIVVPKEEKPAGVSYVDNWTAEVVDFRQLVEAVAGRTLPIDALLPNKSYINQSAKALKGFMKWPGVTIKKERGVRVTQRR